MPRRKPENDAEEPEDRTTRSVSRDELLRQHYDEYRAMLGDEVSEERAREFIESLWLITGHFVDLGFGEDSTSLALKIREREEAKAENKRRQRKPRAKK